MENITCGNLLDEVLPALLISSKQDFAVLDVAVLIFDHIARAHKY